jgi:hypothetical protein
VKVSTSRPADITAIRSHSAISSGSSLETITIALPRAERSSRTL